MKTVTLYCQAGDHDWERQSQRGRKPQSCPEHQTVFEQVQTGEGNDSVGITPTERIDRLEMMLKSRGTHLSQVGQR